MRKLLYLLATIAIFYMSFIYHSKEYLFIGIFMILLAIFSLILLFYQRKYFSLETSVSPYFVGEGDDFTLTLTFHQKKNFPVSKIITKVAIEDQFHHPYKILKKTVKNRYNLEPLQSISYSIHTDYCGLLRCVPTKIYLYDWLSIFRVKAKITNEYFMTVLPTPYPIYVKIPPLAPIPSLESELSDDHNLGDDSSEIYQIRPYQSGDSLSRIHWKLSARKEEFMVKDFSSKQPAGSAIFLDLKNKNKFEKNASAFYKIIYSISLCLLEQDTFHYIMWIDETTNELAFEHISSKKELLEYMFKLYSLSTYTKELDTHQILTHKISSEILQSILYLDTSLTLKKGNQTIYTFDQKQFEKDSSPVIISANS